MKRDKRDGKDGGGGGGANNTKVGVRQARNYRGEGGGLPCPFSKIGKNCPNLEKKMP